MIKSITICEVTTYDVVGELLKKSLEELNKRHYRILNVFETKVNKIPRCKTDQGFIVVYDDKLPSAQPEQTGMWLKDEFGSRCSACGRYAYRDKYGKPWESDYCPNCGAKMKEGDVDDMG